MPQNSIIRADGTGDYTSPIAWEAAEQNSDYGSITVGRLDGFFDNGTSILDINGSWPNGARLEPFDSGEAFDGTERQLCGITTASTSRTIRNRSLSFEMEGLEIYNTSTGSCYWSTGLFSGINCLMKASNGISFRPGDSSGAGAVGCVIVTITNGAVWAVPTKISQSSVIANNTASMGRSSGTQLFTDTVIVNYLAGACFRGNITQSNNASTDSTADTLDNIVVADNFISSDPILDGDYRIKAASPLDTNGIGAFIQGASGISIEVDSGSYSQVGTTTPINAQLNITTTAGSYLLTGSDVNLTSAKKLITETGSYNLTGTDVTLIYTPSGGGETLAGGEVLLRADLIIIANSDDYSISGTSTPIRYNASIIADSGSYSLFGADLNLFANYGMIAISNSYSLTGTSVILKYSGDTNQAIGTVTAGFAPDLYSAGYKPNTITVTFKE